MSKFYGSVDGSEKTTTATRRGFNYIHVSAQSYDGSIITRMHYDINDNLIVDLEHNDGSSTYGRTIFHGTMDELLKKLEAKGA